MIKTEIVAGVCNLGTSIEANSSDGMTVDLVIESNCPQVQALAAELGSVNAFSGLFKPFNQSRVLELAAAHKLHTTCVVPVGIMKAVEAAASMALPARACIEMAKEE